jgi:Gram-negative bacterial TonB protein C-terminal
MHRFAQVLTFTIASLAFLHARGQVMQNTDYEHELAHAKSLLAGVTSTDISHHIHYELKLYDREGHESTATYDIYRDPILYQRIEVKGGNYELTQISNLRDHVEWQHYTGDKPLKIADFEQVLIIPRAAVNRFAQEAEVVKSMYRQSLEGKPLLCANDNQGTAICFDPMIRLFAYAQMFDYTIMYDQWLPIGSHTVPGSIRIYEGKKLLVEATGTVEAVKTFPVHFMEIPDTPTMPPPDSLYKIVKSKSMDLSDPRYGNIQIAVSVDEKGRVVKESIVDSDDKHLEGSIRKFAHNLVFEPRIKDGQPVPFETVLYFEYYPL